MCKGKIEQPRDSMESSAKTESTDTLPSRNNVLIDVVFIALALAAITATIIGDGCGGGCGSFFFPVADEKTDPCGFRVPLHS